MNRALKYFFTAGLLAGFFISLVSGGPAFAKRISFYPPDAPTRKIIEQIFTENNIARQSPIRARAAWLKLEEGAPPFLFARLTEDCGPRGCEIFGFRQDPSGGWTQIYRQHGLQGFVILKTITNGRHDIEQWEGIGESGFRKKTSRWANGAYGAPEIEEKNPKLMAETIQKEAKTDSCITEMCRPGDPPQ